MREIAISTKVLNGFLTLMVGVLVLILVSVVICLILAAFGIL